ncbi:inositol transport system substrate-binding protein [Paenibacillus tianmuensis]|uniref:Inositol transport system substrate-binding protein n=1 Tax=Paenibacillus tianmuensis TaxID=624147 RepID=A0A1G4QGA4_9BACL|nr:substrate-binding domain-containing protein [Paenibacillus tianmuensis]SCW43630.1 inositol transport system substrate-binding protein [Paenibacillus tianmuensis]
MRMTKKSVLSLVVVVLMMVLAACGSGGNGDKNVKASGEQANTNKPITLGFQVYGLQGEYATNLTDAMKAKAAALGVKLVVMDGKYDVSTAISQLRSLESQKVDAIILNPIDETALNDTVNQIVSGGIPVLGVNAFLTAEKLVTYVGSPDVKAGEMEAQQIMDAIGGKGSVVILEGPIGQTGQVGRKEGIYNVLKKNPDVKVIAEKTANWSRAEAMTIMENWIQTHGKDMKAVIAQNDEMAIGALNALEARGMKDVPVVGVDGVKDALQAVKDGKMLATVFQNAKAQGETVIDMAIKAAKGEQIEKKYEIPFELVTKGNVDQYLAK